MVRSRVGAALESAHGHRSLHPCSTALGRGQQQAPVEQRGLMGGVESDSITLSIIQEHVDRIILVKESSILQAMRVLYENEELMIEGAGATSTAALLENASEFVGKRVVVVLSGGNIGEEEIRSLLKD